MSWLQASMDGNPKLGSAGASPPGREPGWSIRNKLHPHKCYHVELYRSALNGVGRNTGEPLKLGCAGAPSSWDGAYAWLIHRNTCVTATNFIFHFRPNSTSVIIMQFRPKNWPFAFRLSRSFQVVRTDTDRSATCDFQLTFHSNHGPISYRFRDKLRFQLKTLIFPSACIYRPAEGFSLKLGNGA